MTDPTKDPAGAPRKEPGAPGEKQAEGHKRTDVDKYTGELPIKNPKQQEPK